jgi:predicted nucleic acid-binding Zn ribbon protein
MAEGADHRHCKVCGKVCAPGAETCSKACARERQRRLDTRRTYTYLLYAAIAIVVVAFALSYH